MVKVAVRGLQLCPKNFQCVQALFYLLLLSLSMSKDFFLLKNKQTKSMEGSSMEGAHGKTVANIPRDSPQLVTLRVGI